MRITILLLVVLFAFTLAKEEGEKKKKEEKKEKKVEEKKGPGSQFLYTVRQRLAALHLQLSVDFRALSACKSASCRAAARARIRDVKRAELLTRRARGHIRLGRIFRDAAACRNSACRQKLREAVREEQRDMRHLIRQGANERAANAKREAARLARRARSAARHAHNAGKIAHHLNKHEKRERMHRFLHLAQHFHGLGLLYARAAECHSHRCAHRMLKKIQRFRKSQKKALERLHQRSVLDALKHARSASHALKIHSVWDSVDSQSEEEEFAQLRRHAKRLMRRAKHAVSKAKRHPDSFSYRHTAARLVRAATHAMEEAKAKAKKEEKTEEKPEKEEEEEEEEEEEPKDEEEKSAKIVVEEKDEDEKTHKAKEVSKKLAESAESEIKDLEEESKKVSGSIKEKLEKKIDLDKALESEFKKAEKCTGMDCIRTTVKHVKSIRFNAAH